MRLYLWLWASLLFACTTPGRTDARVVERMMPAATEAAGPTEPLVVSSSVAGSGAPFPECVTTGTIETTLRPTSLLFVIDRSASMNCNLPPITSSSACEQMPIRADATMPSKWEIVSSALKDALAQLPAAARAGISYFNNDDSCGVQSAPSVPIREVDAEQLVALANSLDAAQQQGGTPIVGSLILAYKHLNPDQNPDVPWGNRFVVLLTDGQEGCAPDQIPRLLETELPKSRTASISTFVIGVPGSEVNRGFLSRLAYAGGTPSRADCEHQSDDPSRGDCHFDMTRDLDLSAGLSRALSAIGGDALRCEFDLPQPTNGEQLDYDTINVVYTERPGGEEIVIRQDGASACDAANGWQYSQDKTKVLLCGTACEVVRRAASIRIALGCQTILL